MDILWALHHTDPTTFAGATMSHASTGLFTPMQHFSVSVPQYADPQWEMYEDFVGGVQFWGYALVSGSGDGAVRMWDSTFDLAPD
jgi:division protein 1